MPLWQRLLVTLVAMAAASLSYLAGVVGGLTAVPVWEFLKRLRPKPPRAAPPPV